MKTILLCTVSVFVFCTMQGQTLYDLSTIQEMKIYFPFSNWDQKLDSLKTADSDGRLIASYVLLNGTRFDSVGIRYKGNSTYNPNRIKNPMNIKLDFVKQNQSYEGFSTLKLSNGFMDPSMLREVMGYIIARKYLPASQANFITLFVNDVYIGLYTNVENIDGDFLSDHYYSSDNAFFQCDRTDKQIQLPGNCPPGNPGSALRFFSTDSNCYYNSYEKESDYGWKSLLRLMQQLNQNPNAISAFLNVDRALWMLALNNFYVNLDSYTGSGHNYLLYENNKGIFQPILWDLNEFYGAFTNAGMGGQLNVAQMRMLDPLLHLTNPDRPLISKLLANSSTQKRYLAHLLTILDEAEIDMSYEGVGLQLQTLIKQAVKDDRNKFFNDTAFEQNLLQDYTITGGPNGGKTYPGLIKFTQERIAFLKTHSKLNVSKPAFDWIKYLIREDSVFTEFKSLIQVLNAKQAWWYYRYDKSDSFSRIELFDDGILDDGIVGNKIYGNTLSFKKNLEIQFYYYAENDFIAGMVPERAEYEFYTFSSTPITVEKDHIQINEVMSSNTSYQKDESGEFDDWIEFYNPTDQSISLHGLYVSDNPSNLFKWNFPDTFIAPKSYLIVWADEDGQDPGLHANFKLSKSGEKLFLYNYDSTAVNELDVPALDENKSYGRCDSSLRYFSMPTFSKENVCETKLHQVDKNKTIHIFPNPCSGSCTLSLLFEKDAKIEIFDLLGTLIREIRVQNKIQKNTTIELEGLAGGIYFVRYFMDSDSGTYSFIVQ